jgi:hypothetical protein
MNPYETEMGGGRSEEEGIVLDDSRINRCSKINKEES